MCFPPLPPTLQIETECESTVIWVVILVLLPCSLHMSPRAFRSPVSPGGKTMLSLSNTATSTAYWATPSEELNPSYTPSLELRCGWGSGIRRLPRQRDGQEEPSSGSGPIHNYLRGFPGSAPPQWACQAMPLTIWSLRYAAKGTTHCRQDEAEEVSSSLT